MPTWLIHYEIPPLRAVYTCECTCDTETEARASFATGIPHGKILTVKQKQETEESSGN